MPSIDLTADPILYAHPPGVPEQLLHPYFKRIDFAPRQSAVEMHLGRPIAPFGIYTGR